MSGKGKVYVGTSGWHYMHWKGPFYPAKAPARRFLDHYAEHFNATEINNTFYRLPKPETFMEWRDRTPSGFRFAVKASRYITHMKKLKDVGEGLAKFFDGIAALEDRLGPILFQLPPNLKPDLERLEGFLDSLPDKGLYVRSGLAQ